MGGFVGAWVRGWVGGWGWGVRRLIRSVIKDGNPWGEKAYVVTRKKNYGIVNTYAYYMWYAPNINRD